MISKTHIIGQKPRGRHLNAKVCGSKSAIFRLLCSDHLSNDNSKTAQVLTLILAWNWCSSQREASQPFRVFIASNSSWSTKAIQNILWWLSVAKDAIFKVQSSKFKVSSHHPRGERYKMCNEKQIKFTLLKESLEVWMLQLSQSLSRQVTINIWAILICTDVHM